jgi:hypothetical protein
MAGRPHGPVKELKEGAADAALFHFPLFRFPINKEGHPGPEKAPAWSGRKAVRGAVLEHGDEDNTADGPRWRL